MSFTRASLSFAGSCWQIFDVSTADIRAQPLRLTAMVGGRKRWHVPDFLLVSVDGAVTVVNVKLASRVADPRVAEQLAWPAALFAARGWGYEVWTGCDATVLANVRFLAMAITIVSTGRNPRQT